MAQAQDRLFGFFHEIVSNLNDPYFPSGGPSSFGSRGEVRKEEKTLINIVVIKMVSLTI